MNGSDQKALAAARDTETLVTGIVFTVPQAFPKEHAAAESRLNRGKLPAALWLLSKVLKLFNNGYVLFAVLERE
jgi:hypothetical protein